MFLFRVNPGFPDTRTSILHQKLQLLNCCIERKKTREQKEFSPACADFDEAQSSEADSEDEYFDCNIEKEEVPFRHSLWNKPVGRLSKHGNLKLINTGEQLYIPITQEPVPKTEDQLEEDADVLLKLGEDEHGSELRARMMSASLLSDMESFKAANPDCIIEDFIRWYSPADWVEEKELDQWDQKKGHLSTRMLISDNTWIQMWDSAKPVPSNRQKRLFDDTREAEKVLHYLEATTLSQICELLLPVLSHIAIFTLNNEKSEVIKSLPNAIINMDDITKSVRMLSRESRIILIKYETVFQEISTQELMICQLKSLKFKFNPEQKDDEIINSFIVNLEAEKEILVDGCGASNIGKRLIGMFSEVQNALNLSGDSLDTQNSSSNKTSAFFPPPSKREFVMRVKTERPELKSQPLYHMLRAILTKNEFRLCGAFSENIIS